MHARTCCFLLLLLLVLSLDSSLPFCLLCCSSTSNFFTAKGEYAEPTFSEAVQTWYSKSIQKLKNKGS